MQVWIATIGTYEDEMIVGVGSTEEAARELIAKAIMTPGNYRDGDAVYGPLDIDEAYLNYGHEKI